MRVAMLLGVAWLLLLPLGCRTGVIGGASRPDGAPPSGDGGVAGDGAPLDANLDDGGTPPPMDGGAPPADGAAPADAGPPLPGPDSGCTLALPSQAQLADTSNPTTVVGTGTAASCTYAALAAAVAQGGVITFDCGAAPLTITITATLALKTDRDTVIDGGDRVTLDGAGQVRLLSWDSPGWMTNTHTLTLQRLALVNGKTTPVEAIPPCPSPCSQGYNDGEGGALYMRDGALRVIDATFTGNQAAPLGPDTGGGAIYLLGCQPAYIVRSIFRDNQASNAGAVGTLFAENNVYDSLFENNHAIGTGANNNDPSQCSCINNGQNEIGSGGNGGAIYSDGVAVSVTICGTTISDNAANEFGAAIFFTSNDSSQKGTLTIRDSSLSHNVGNGIWEAAPGISTNANFPAPVNSTIQ